MSKKWYLIAGAGERVFTNDYRDAVSMANYLNVSESVILEISEPPTDVQAQGLANNHKSTVTIRYRPLTVLITILVTSGIAYGILKLIAWVGMNFS